MAKPVYTDQQIADQLTRDGFHWNDTTITYAFPTTGGQSGSYGVDATQQAWIREAIALVGDVVDLSFVEVSSGTSADIEFRNAVGGGTYTSWSYNYFTREFGAADVYLDQTWSSNQPANLSYGSYGFTTILHEFLHGMGLAHPGDYDAGSGGTITYAGNAEFEQDTHRYSVMSYFNAYEDGSGTSHYFWDGSTWQWYYPQSPMVYDILALQEGSFGGYFGGNAANTSTRTGDTTYGYNATADRDIFDFTINAAPVLTIYDAGGTDTLDLSGDNASRAVQPIYDASGQLTGWQEVSSTYVRAIDLHEGAYSSTHGLTNNIGIAFGTVIENAVGTNYRDIITGNDVANRLEGLAGDDTLYGKGGNDTAVYSGNLADYTITDLGGGTYTISDNRPGAPDGIDTLIGIETLVFADNPGGVSLTAVPSNAIRLEAEDFDNLGSFFVNNSGNASGSELIRLVGSTSGIATTDLAAAGVAAGTYDVTVAYFDESDGVSDASLWLDGVQIGTWRFDDPSGQDAAQASNLRTFTVAGVPVASDSVLELHAAAHGGELARIDFVELTESTAQPAAPLTVRLEAEDFDNLGSFFVNNSGNASGSELIRLVGGTSGVATTDLATAGLAAGTYDVTVAYFDESDGISNASLWLDGVQVGTWNFDDPSGQDAAQASNLRTFTVAGVSVASELGT